MCSGAISSPRSDPGAVVGRTPAALVRAAAAAAVVFAALAAPAAAPAAPAAAVTDDYSVLTDTAGSGVHTPAMNVLESLGVLHGTECGPGRLCPTVPMRRWVMAVWLVRALDGGDPARTDSGVREDSNPAAGAAGFTDVANAEWWSGHVRRLTALGISNGCAARPLRFCPDETVTRARAAVFLTRAFDLEPGPEPAGFTDVPGHRHASSINALAAAGIASGCGAEPAVFCPDAPVTRAEMASMLARALGLVPSAEHADLVVRHGIDHLVSSYTTYHSCCASRVSNIQRFADIVDGAVVQPGEEFSLNRHVGKRTSDRGFLPAGTLIRGELVNTVGGGVSQFATTFYNAVFWGGYEDVTHKAHSFYFSRYPEGIEATVNWPDVNLVFRNNTDRPVLIATRYTGTSITVEFFGDNDGRILVGEWKDRRNHLEVVDEGGPQARRITAEVSDRFRWTGPPAPLMRANPQLAVGQVKRKQSARAGWSVLVTRTIDQAGRKTIQEWNVRYLPRREINEVHPCVLTDTCSPPEESETPESDPAGG